MSFLIINIVDELKKSFPNSTICWFIAYPNRTLVPRKKKWIEVKLEEARFCLSIFADTIVLDVQDVVFRFGLNRHWSFGKKASGFGVLIQIAASIAKERTEGYDWSRFILENFYLDTKVVKEFVESHPDPNVKFVFSNTSIRVNRKSVAVVMDKNDKHCQLLLFASLMELAYHAEVDLGVWHPSTRDEDEDEREDAFLDALRLLK